LKSAVIEGLMLDATAFSIFADTPSGPFAFEMSRVLIRLKTLSSAHTAGKWY